MEKIIRKKTNLPPVSDFDCDLPPKTSNAVFRRQVKDSVSLLRVYILLPDYEWDDYGYQAGKQYGEHEQVIPDGIIVQQR